MLKLMLQDKDVLKRMLKRKNKLNRNMLKRMLKRENTFKGKHIFIHHLLIRLLTR